MVESRVGPFDRVPRAWLLAILLYGVGDLVTTLLGTSLEHVVEAGPIADPFLEQFGPLAVVALKPLTLGIGYLLWRATPEPQNVGVPLGLAAVGAATTAWNCLVIAGLT